MGSNKHLYEAIKELQEELRRVNKRLDELEGKQTIKKNHLFCRHYNKMLSDLDECIPHQNKCDQRPKNFKCPCGGLHYTKEEACTCCKVTKGCTVCRPGFKKPASLRYQQIPEALIVKKTDFSSNIREH